MDEPDIMRKKALFQQNAEIPVRDIKLHIECKNMLLDKFYIIFEVYK